MNVVELLGHPATRPHLVVVIGKGGVGKTTISILFSLELCKHGKTLLLSLDPARHMSKYLNIGDRDYVVVLENLHVKQVSVDKEIAELTSKYADLLRDLMPSLAVLNIDNVVDTIRYSPGVEEEIFLKVMLEALRENYDFVVVDTPPTGITLRTLMLPRLYLAWLEKLIEVRERIVSLRYVIARALGRKVEMHDKVLSKLYELRKDFEFLNSFLSSNEKTSYILVATPEPLPMYELRESYRFLSEKISVKPKVLVLNRILPVQVASALGLVELQERYISEISSFGVSYLLVEHMNKPTETLEDILALRERIMVFRK